LANITILIEGLFSLHHDTECSVSVGYEMLGVVHPTNRRRTVESCEVCRLTLD